MSKFITEIVSDIRDNPLSWKRIGQKELSKWEITISHFWNGSMLFWCWFNSIINVEINWITTTSSQLSLKDKIKLEETFIWWLKNIPLSHLNKYTYDN